MIPTHSETSDDRPERLAELEDLVSRLDRENLRLRQALAGHGATAAGDSPGTIQLEEERRIFVSGPVVVFKWRNAPGWPVEYVSPNVPGVFGHGAEAFLRGNVLYGDLVHPDDIERVASEVAAATDSGRTSFQHRPYRIVDRSGRTVWLDDFTTILRDATGAATHYLGYVIDITERVRAEEERQRLEAQMLQAQKLEGLGVLAGGMAHDFNNLLGSILGRADLAREDAPAETAEHLDRIVVAARRAAELCDAMLAYSGRGTTEVRPLDLNQLVREMRHLLEVSVAKGVELVDALEPGLPPVEGDASQLRQVIMNLITNASEACADEGGRVTLSTGTRVVHGDEQPGGSGPVSPPAPGRYVTLTVLDTGCGMDADTRGRLFDPFFTTKFTGRGLGLAAVLGILRQHGGGIEVESTAGAGSAFRVLLPASDRPVDRLDEEDETTELRGGGLALVVEDEAVVRDVMVMALERLGFDVLAAADGVEGLAQLEAHRAEVELAVLDVTMPRMGAGKALPRLRALRPDLPVLICSGFDASDVMGSFAGIESVAFLHKPFSIEQFVRALSRLVPREA